MGLSGQLTNLIQTHPSPNGALSRNCWALLVSIAWAWRRARTPWLHAVKAPLSGAEGVLGDGRQPITVRRNWTETCQ